jgi:hypothetical protein
MEINPDLIAYNTGAVYSLAQETSTAAAALAQAMEEEVNPNGGHINAENLAKARIILGKK